MFDLQGRLINKGWLERRIGGKPCSPADDHQPAVAGIGGNRLERHQSAVTFIELACQNLPVNFNEVFESEIFAESDIADIESGAYRIEDMQLYIASWLIAGRTFPFVLRHDWLTRLD
jgi:hypothetical protein